MNANRIEELRRLCEDNGVSASTAITALPEALDEVVRLRVLVLQFCASNCIWNINGYAHENTLNCEHCGFDNA